MPDAPTYWLFVAAALALLLVPGPAIFYIIARSVEGGRVSGLASVLGIGTGTLCHVAFAAAGLSAIVAASATAFSAVKWMGVAYLVWLGLHRIFARDEEHEAPNTKPEPLSRVFRQSVLVQVLNPKVALFFLAFLPQFVDPSQGVAWTQVIVLGATLTALGLLTDGVFALLGGTAGDWLKRRGENKNFRRGQRYLSGGTYIALGAAAAVTDSGKD